MIKTVPDIEHELAIAYEDLKLRRAHLQETIRLVDELPEPYATHMQIYIPRVEAGVRKAQTTCDQLLLLLKEVTNEYGRQLKLNLWQGVNEYSHKNT